VYYRSECVNQKYRKNWWWMDITWHVFETWYEQYLKMETNTSWYWQCEILRDICNPTCKICV